MGCLHSKCCFRAASELADNQRANPNDDPKAFAGAAASPSSSGLLDEGEDQVRQLNPRDSDVGISRLDRVSSQFLPPDGSRTVRVPMGNYDLRYSYLSQRGYYPEALDKANQDSFCIHTPFGTSIDDHFFGVFDGHGEFGTQCSQFVKRKLCENLLRNAKFHTDPVEAIHSAYLSTNSQLHSDSLDDSMSGTTAVTVLVRGRKVYVANTGDSRAVIAEKRGNELVAVDLSVDQTPFRQDELERVKLCGARVLTLDQIEGLKNPEIQYWGNEGDDGDPPRVWVQNGMYPGTAFTRSIGDSIAESIGVIPNPEIVVLELSTKNPFFIVASDGVFEFLTSQNVVDMVAKFKDPRDACAAIVAESYRLWLQFETRTDDITIIVVHVNGIIDTDHVQSKPPVPLRPYQVVELTGSESPLDVTWNSKNQRVRHDISRTRLKAIESSLESGPTWVPPSPSHRKTWEEEAHIERVLRDHFLFRKLTDSQCHVLLDCMQRVDVMPGDVVVQQGGEGDCFYVVGSGEFEVLATQSDENGKEVTRVLHQYTAEKMSSFGELALMYNKPLQSSVRAVTTGTLWALKREDFRGILMSEFSNLSSLKLLRSVNLLSKLTILQLSRISESLLEVSFSDGQTIVDQNESLSSLYIILKGQVRLTCSSEILRYPNMRSFSPGGLEYTNHSTSQEEHELDLPEGSYFGDWALLGQQISSLKAVARGSVVCVVITKDKFDSAVGSLSKLQLDDHLLKGSLSSSRDWVAGNNVTELQNVQFPDLEWKICLHASEYSEIGLVQLKGSGNMLTLKRFSKKRVKQLGKKSQALKEREILKSLNPSSHVPQVLSTFSNQSYAGILLNVCLACPLASILHTPFDEPSARFCAASVVVALEELHKNFILYRGLSPDILMLDQSGNLQLIDFRFGEKLAGEKTFTICGVADYLAPEIIQGKGHGLAADWWALGVLVYFMLQAEMPFGSWRESEVETVARIAKGQFTLPHTFSTEAVDLISKLLEVNEELRLGSQDAGLIKQHPWFEGIDWKGIADHSIPAPQLIIARIDVFLENHKKDAGILAPRPSEDADEQQYSDLFEDW